MLGWEKVSVDVYRRHYDAYGGSVITHPDILEFIHARKKIDHAYYVRKGDNGRAAVCRWRHWVAGDFQALKELVSPDYDFGEPEVIVPMDVAGPRHHLWLRAETLSAQCTAVRNRARVRKEKNFIALAKGYGPDGMSSKAKYSRRRELKIFANAGGTIRPVSAFSTETLADLYAHLYQLRRGETLASRDGLADYLSALRAHVFGSVLFIKDQPCAFQMVLSAESPNWVSYEYINSGTDRSYAEFSPGSVLTWVNTWAAWEYAAQQNKQLRYSFGKNRGQYKSAWCTAAPMYRTLTF